VLALGCTAVPRAIAPISTTASSAPGHGGTGAPTPTTTDDPGTYATPTAAGPSGPGTAGTPSTPGTPSGPSGPSGPSDATAPDGNTGAAAAAGATAPDRGATPGSTPPDLALVGGATGPLAGLITTPTPATPPTTSGPGTAATTLPPWAAGPTPSPTPTLPATGAGAPIFFHGRRDQPKVALTFDTNMTPFMLGELDRGQVSSFANLDAIEVLDQQHVPATIFLSGLWIQRYPDVTHRLAADPLFELGSHSYAHVGFRPGCYGLGTLRPDQMADDVQHSFDVLRRFTDHPVPYFRFPGGCYDATALAAIRGTGVTVIQYDVASGDAFGTSVNAIVRGTLAQVTNGSIVVMHLTGGNTAPLTARALPAIVDGLRAKGYQLVTVSQLIAATQVS